MKRPHPPKTAKRPAPPKPARASAMPAGRPGPDPRRPRLPARSAGPSSARRDELEVLPGEQSLLDLVDNLLNRGVVISGDAVLGVADVDLVYLKLSALLCAADKLVR